MGKIWTINHCGFHNQSKYTSVGSHTFQSRIFHLEVPSLFEIVCFPSVYFNWVFHWPNACLTMSHKSESDSSAESSGEPESPWVSADPGLTACDLVDLDSDIETGTVYSILSFLPALTHLPSSRHGSARSLGDNWWRIGSFPYDFSDTSRCTLTAIRKTTRRVSHRERYV